MSSVVVFVGEECPANVRRPYVDMSLSLVGHYGSPSMYFVRVTASAVSETDGISMTAAKRLSDSIIDYRPLLLVTDIKSHCVAEPPRPPPRRVVRSDQIVLHIGRRTRANHGLGPSLVPCLYRCGPFLHV